MESPAGENWKHVNSRIPQVEGSRSPISSRGRLLLRNAVIIVFTCMLLLGSYSLLASPAVSSALPDKATLPDRRRSTDCSSPSSSVPQYFQTSPELWTGPTATGRAPFLAQTNPVSFAPTVTFVPNNPLETAEPIMGQAQNQSIFQLMGNLSPYFSNPIGFGVAEYPLPPGANISQVQVGFRDMFSSSSFTDYYQMLSRHGSRYPTGGSNVQTFGRRIANATGNFKATGPLSFLNTWKYELGEEILVPRGRQELFNSGILHYYQYAQLYNPNSKIIARTTTQDRMLKVCFLRRCSFLPRIIVNPSNRARNTSWQVSSVWNGQLMPRSR
jgi:hypothetical protein